MKQLESVEQYLVEQLGKTQNTQRKALENLHSVVQLCNSRIDAPNNYQSTAIITQKNASSPALLMNQNQHNARSFSHRSPPTQTDPPIDSSSVMITQIAEEMDQQEQMKDNNRGSMKSPEEPLAN